jgi:hypothetical protein
VRFLQLLPPTLSFVRTIADHGGESMIVIATTITTLDVVSEHVGSEIKLHLRPE